MKTEALKLADEFDEMTDPFQSLAYAHKAQAMIRRLVEELDKQTYKADLLENRLKVIVGSKPLSDDEITYQFEHKCPRFSRLDIFKYAVKWAEERHGIK